ncbi:MAG TPA: histidine phosphatase family protein [Acidimicrobiales bacterium]|jgi:broad specificity phosphatase PhoE|nr:histidine phosphatase family protein [Acidimicrobiales bacterium]
MGTTRVILVRHAAPQHHVDGITGGPRGDGGITDDGRAQAERLAQRLAAAPWATAARLYASTLPRAIETAEIVGAALGSDSSSIKQHCGLCSYHFPPELDAIPVKELWSNQVPGAGVYTAYEQGNEPWIGLLARSGAALFEIAQANIGATAIVVTHGEVVQASLVAFGELPIRRHFDLAVTPTSITEWTTEDDLLDTGFPHWRFPRWTLRRLNDAAHLETLAA